MRYLKAVFLSAFCARLASADVIHYLELVNDANSSLVAFSVAAAGSDDWAQFQFGDAPLQGGGASATLGLRRNDCLVDLRSAFADGRVLTVRDFNLCRLRSFHPGVYLRRLRGHSDATSAR